MRSYKKRSIITGILWIIVNKVICTGIPYKEENQNRDIKIRKVACNLPLISRETASEVLDTASTSKERIAENQLYINNMPPDKNNQPILYDESESSNMAILDVSKSHTNQNCNNNYIILWLNNTQNKKYKNKENKRTINTNKIDIVQM